ncbi:MAG TPA: tetratricopeptide repeat protein [Longimicrobiales bacterium]
MKELIDSSTLPQLETLLDNLEQRAQKSARPAEQARIHNLAGDMCVDANQLERGLSYYDKAITTYSDCEQYDSAGRICEKILALSPSSVRPYSTLAWLALKRGREEEARRRIVQYVDAADTHGLARLARGYLVKLADLAKSNDVLQTIADGLLQLEDSEAANSVYGRMARSNQSNMRAR